MIHIYYGYGKGKTSSAVGLGMRAYGAGMSVLMVQFLKDNKSSELKSVPFDVFEAPDSLPFNPDKDAYLPWINSAFDYIRNSKSDVIILDELIDIAESYVPLESIVSLLSGLKDKEVVVTGHKKLDALIDMADYVVRFESEKHPYDNGVTARKGIEY